MGFLGTKEWAPKNRDDKARKEMAKKIVMEEIKDCLGSQPLTL